MAVSETRPGGEFPDAQTEIGEPFVTVDPHLRETLLQVKQRALPALQGEPATLGLTVEVLGEVVGTSSEFDTAVVHHLGREHVLVNIQTDREQKRRPKVLTEPQVYAVATILHVIKERHLQPGVPINWNGFEGQTSIEEEAISLLGDDPIREELRDHLVVGSNIQTSPPSHLKLVDHTFTQPEDTDVEIKDSTSHGEGSDEQRSTILLPATEKERISDLLDVMDKFETEEDPIKETHLQRIHNATAEMATLLEERVLPLLLEKNDVGMTLRDAVAEISKALDMDEQALEGFSGFWQDEQEVIEDAEGYLGVGVFVAGLRLAQERGLRAAVGRAGEIGRAAESMVEEIAEVIDRDENLAVRKPVAVSDVVVVDAQEKGAAESESAEVDPRRAEFLQLIEGATPEMHAFLEEKILPLLLAKDTPHTSLRGAVKEIIEALEMDKRMLDNIYLHFYQKGGVKTTEKYRDGNKTVVVDAAGFLAIGAFVETIRVYDMNHTKDRKRELKGDNGVIRTAMNALGESQIIKDKVLFYPYTDAPAKAPKQRERIVRERPPVSPAPVGVQAEAVPARSERGSVADALRGTEQRQGGIVFEDTEQAIVTAWERSRIQPARQPHEISSSGESAGREAARADTERSGDIVAARKEDHERSAVAEVTMEPDDSVVEELDGEAAIGNGEQDASASEVVFASYPRPYEIDAPTHVLFDSGRSRTALTLAHTDSAKEGSALAHSIIAEARERDRQEAEGRAKKTQRVVGAEPKVPKGYVDYDNQTGEGISGNDTFRNKAGHIGHVEKIEVDENGTTYVSVSYPGNLISKFPISSIGRTHFRIRQQIEE